MNPFHVMMVICGMKNILSRCSHLSGIISSITEIGGFSETFSRLKTLNNKSAITVSFFLSESLTDLSLDVYSSICFSCIIHMRKMTVTSDFTGPKSCVIFARSRMSETTSLVFALIFVASVRGVELSAGLAKLTVTILVKLANSLNF